MVVNKDGETMDVDEEDEDELAPLKEPFRMPQLTTKYAIRYDLKLQTPQRS